MKSRLHALTAGGLIDTPASTRCGTPISAASEIKVRLRSAPQTGRLAADAVWAISHDDPRTADDDAREKSRAPTPPASEIPDDKNAGQVLLRQRAPTRAGRIPGPVSNAARPVADMTEPQF